MKNIINLRKTLFLLITILCATYISAQEKGYGAIGANIVGGFGNSYSNLGVGAKIQLNVLHPIRLEGSFTSFIRNKNISMIDGSLNAHWLAFINDAICIYPLVGAGIYHTTVYYRDSPNSEAKEHTKSETKVCGNFGGGMDYYLTDVIILNFEAKYKYIPDASRYNVSLGIAYLF